MVISGRCWASRQRREGRVYHQTDEHDHQLSFRLILSIQTLARACDPIDDPIRSGLLLAKPPDAPDLTTFIAMARSNCKYLISADALSSPPTMCRRTASCSNSDHILSILSTVLSTAEACMIDKAGLLFVVTTPSGTLDMHDRKAIRSQARRARVAGRQTSQLKSWICPDRELRTLRTANEESSSKSVLSAPSPRRMGGDFSGLQLPSGIEPYMVQDLVKCRSCPFLSLLIYL